MRKQAPGDVVEGVSVRWRERWARLCDWMALEIPGLAAGDRLLAHYSEAGRYYHGAGHILQCLDELDRYPAAIDEPDAVELALWYHDCVYDAKAEPGANEAASARVFRDEFPPAAPGRSDETKVVALILETSHRDEPESPDAALIRDVDLSVLGTDPPRYQQYASDIRREYAHVSDRAFQAGRAEVLKSFLAREKIYATTHFRKVFEDRARENLVGELDRISGA